MSDYEKWCEIIKNTPSHQRVLEKARETIMANAPSIADDLAALKAFREETIRIDCGESELMRLIGVALAHAGSPSETGVTMEGQRRIVADPACSNDEYAFAGPAADAESVLADLDRLPDSARRSE